MENTPDPRSECLGSAALLVLGLAYFWFGLRYPAATLADPGPGVLPRALGASLVALAALHLLRSALRLRRGATPASAAPSAAGEAASPGASGRTPWVMVGLLAVYLLVVGRVGFVPSTGVITVACTKLMGTPGWVRPIALAAGVLLVCHLLFAVWLKVPLPTAHFG